MSARHESWSRRDFVSGLTGAGAAGFLGLRAERAAAEPPPETTRIRLPHIAGICVAPQVVAEDLLRAEGFTDVHYVRFQGPPMTANMKALAAGETDLAVTYTTNTVLQIDAGDPVVLLAGVHVGCFELFGGERVRAVRDLRGRKVSVPELGVSHHTFVSMMAAHVGLDPRKDIEWVIQPGAEGQRSLAEGKVDAIMAFPPDPQDLRAKKIGRVVVNSAIDRPWSQYICCMIGGNKEFVRKNPVATKRAIRAMLKAATVCATEPERAARLLVAARRDRELRVRAPGTEGASLQSVARDRSDRHGSLLVAAPARGRTDQERPQQDHRPGHGLALLQRAEEGAEGVTETDYEPGSVANHEAHNFRMQPPTSGRG